MYVEGQMITRAVEKNKTEDELGCLGDRWLCALTLVILCGKHSINIVLFFLKS